MAKILFFRESEIKNLNPDEMRKLGFGATETSFILLAEKLSKIHEVKVCCPCKKQEFYGKVEYIPYQNFYAQVLITVNLFQPDILIVVGNPKILLDNEFNAKKIIFWHQNHPVELRMVFWQHNHPLELKQFPILKLFEKKIYFVFPSPESADFAKKFYYGNNEFIHGIYNGVREDFFIENKKIKNKIVYSGSLSRAKGLLELLKVVDKLQNYDISICGGFDMYGFVDINYKNECMKYITPKIKFTGTLNAKQLAYELSTAELCIANPIIGNRETCCVSALEAMATKTCVLAGGNSNIDPIIAKGGLSYTSNLTEIIDKMMHDDEKRNQLAQNGNSWVKALTWDNVAKQWEQFLNV